MLRRRRGVWRGSQGQSGGLGKDVSVGSKDGQSCGCSRFRTWWALVAVMKGEPGSTGPCLLDHSKSMGPGEPWACDMMAVRQSREQQTVERDWRKKDWTACVGVNVALWGTTICWNRLLRRR